MTDQVLRTVDDARAWLDRHGVSVTEWALAHGFQPTVVFAVLSGRTRGRRGQAHRVAVALQIKAAASSCESSPLADVPKNWEKESRRSNPTPGERAVTMA